MVRSPLQSYTLADIFCLVMFTPAPNGGRSGMSVNTAGLQGYF